MASNVTPTSKRISHEIAKIDMQIVELNARRKAMWDAQHIAEAYEADITREMERKQKEANLSSHKFDPMRNIIEEPEFKPGETVIVDDRPDSIRY